VNTDQATDIAIQGYQHAGFAISHILAAVTNSALDIDHSEVQNRIPPRSSALENVVH